jgi:hypothetical protein
MKREITITILLLAATVLVTVVYFRHLSNTTQHTSLVMRTIPNDASLIFEFNNDKEFYDIFSGDKLFSNFLGDDKRDELSALRKQLLQNPLIAKYLSLYTRKKAILLISCLRLLYRGNFKATFLSNSPNNQKTGC